MVFDVQPTVNPLVYKATMVWRENVAGTIALQVWNLLQRWLVTNDCVPNGSVVTTPTSLTVHIIVKRRLGDPKDVSP
jgi:hypothetical protein